MKKTKVKIIILFAIIVLIVISMKFMFPQSKAEESTSTESIVVNFSSGDMTGAFESKSYTLSANSVSGYVTLPEDFKNTVTMNSESYYEKVDDETFYFEEDDYSYTFTGWKIVSADEILPSETVFQPGDSIDIELLKQYATSSGTVELEALWGKVIYAENAYSTMYYTDYWILDLDTTKTYSATGAWNYAFDSNNEILFNDGKDVDEPICSVDYAYYLIYQMDYKDNFSNGTSHNGYEYVIMLTGDLDYVKSNSNGNGQTNYFTTYDSYDGTYDSTKHYIFGEYTAQQQSWGYVNKYNSSGTLSSSTSDSNARKYSPSVTFKSVQCDGETYNLVLNQYGYYDNTYSSIRFDNVGYTKVTTAQKPNNSSPVSIATETAFLGRENCYLEFTARSSSDTFTFRPNGLQIVVLNGGTMTSWETSYSSSQNSTTNFGYDIHWYMGRNATVKNNIVLGTSSTYESNESIINQNITFTMTGGSATNIYGASGGLNSQCIGTKTINIIGDGTTTLATSPKVTNVYGAGKEGILTGDTYVTIKGTVNVSNVYGGGYAFTATTYGNTNVVIENSTLSGDVFGGGYNGNVEEDDDGNGGYVNLSIEGSVVKGNIYGSGMGGTQTLTTSVNKGFSQDDTDWQNEEFVPTDSDFDSIKNSANGDYDTDWSWDVPATGFPYVQDETEYICVAIYKATTWTNNNASYISFYRYYIYAYLSLATVENDVNITINGSKIGTEGDTSKGNVYGGGSVATVGGDTYVTITGNSTIYGSVYGGGDGVDQPSGVTVYYPASSTGYEAPSYTVTKNSSGSVTNVTTETESTSYKSYTYGTFSWSNDTDLLKTNGIDESNSLIYSSNVGELGTVKGDTTVVVKDSTITGNIVSGGNAANVEGSCTLTVENSTATNIYGGGYSGDIKGSTEITISSVECEELFGGCYSGNVEGDSTILVNSAEATEVFGGGYSGYIGGNTSVTILEGTFTNIFGGCDQSYVTGNTTVIIGDDDDLGIEVKEVVYGGGRGYDSNNDGDASDYVTVKGSSNVTIEGINTTVENYGSIKLRFC